MTSGVKKKRPTLLKCRQMAAKHFERLSFSFERVDVRPILRAETTLTPTTRAARRLSRRARLIRFRSRISVLEITPLADKPGGRVRMPIEDLDDEEDRQLNDDEGNEKENNPTFSDMFFANSLPLSKQLQPSIAQLPIALNLETELHQIGDCLSHGESSALIEPATPNIHNLWSVEESEAYELGQKRLRKTTELWCSAFTPRTREEIFNNSTRIYGWLADWVKRLSTEKPEASGSVKAKRKRRSIMYDDDEDEDYQCPDRELPNPLIVAGPSGCGKTSAIYCAAEYNKMRVLEFSPSERRNGASLEKKMSGAIESHYIHSNSDSLKKADLRQIFSPISKNNNNSPTYKFSVVLIDDCDIVYSTDDNFWSTLKMMFDEAKIPIILTCTDYDYVKRKLSADARSCEWVQFSAPSVTKFSRQLRAWLTGYTNKLLSVKWLRTLIESRHGDARAVLNAVQFQLSTRKLEANREGPAGTLSLKSHARCVYALAELDAAFGVEVSSPAVTWRARVVSDLDYKPETCRAYQHIQRDEMSFSDCAPLIDSLSNFLTLKQISPLLSPSSDFRRQEPLKALKDAWMRSWPRTANSYSWQSVGTDYMPTLWAIDEKYQRELRQRPALGTMCTRRRGRTWERTQHTFDDIDPGTCEAIDKMGGLRLSIGRYAFSNVFQPTY